MSKGNFQITISIFNNSNIYNNSSNSHYFDSDCDSEDYISDNDEEEDDEYEYEYEDEEEDDDDAEIFKRIKGYPNYSLSNHGIVWSDTSNRSLKPGINGKGYYNVSLSKKRISKKHSIHRLIGLTFIANPDDKPIVNHIDGDPSNNHVQNLVAWLNLLDGG